MENCARVNVADVSDAQAGAFAAEPFSGEDVNDAGEAAVRELACQHYPAPCRKDAVRILRSVRRVCGRGRSAVRRVCG